MAGLGGVATGGGAVGLTLGQATLDGGYGWALIKVLAALVLVCLLAYILLRVLQRHLGTSSGPGRGCLRVVERCPLSPRQSLWVVEAAGRYFLLGGSDSGVQRLAELDPDSVPELPAGGGGFWAALQREKASRKSEDGGEGEAGA